MSLPEEQTLYHSLEGQVAIVTGAAQGIGRAIVERLASAGATTLAADHNEELVREMAAATSSRGAEVIPYVVDVTDEAAVCGLVDAACGRSGRLSILVNNAGISTVGLIEDVSIADWQRVLDVNLTGPFITCKSVVPVLRAGGGGKIVNVASVAAKRISANMAASYTASKAGLLAFTRHLAYETAPWRINVNAICPGPVASPMLYRTGDVDERVARLTSTIPVGRLTTPEDQANAVLFLCSPLADMITGVALDIDGGALLGWEPVSGYLARHGIAAPSADSRGDTVDETAL